MCYWQVWDNLNIGDIRENGDLENNGNIGNICDVCNSGDL